MNSQEKRYQSLFSAKEQAIDRNPKQNDRKRSFSIPSIIDLSQDPARGIRFNKDERYYTPTFLHESQDAFYKHNDQVLKIKFQQKINDARKIKKSTSIYQPKPNREFCDICKESFTDYTKHINHPYHIRKIGDSQCKQSIYDLCQIFKNHMRLFAFEKKGKDIYQRSTRKRLKKQKQECDQIELSAHTISDTIWSE